MNNSLRLQFAEMINGVTFYMVLVGMIYACVFIVGAFFIGCWESLGPRPAIASYFRRVGKLALFLLVLLVVGDFFGVVWNTIIHNRMYHSPGYDGLDFVPWYPVTQGMVEASFGADSGRLIGVKLWQLQAIWVVFAILTWSSTLLVYEKIAPQPDFSRRRVRARARV